MTRWLTATHPLLPSPQCATAAAAIIASIEAEGVSGVSGKG